MKLKTKFKLLGLLLAAATGVTAYLSIRFYPYAFGSTVSGEVVAIEKFPPSSNDQIPGDNDPAHLRALSYGLAIRDQTGRIFTVNTKDRQWAVVEKGDCVRAVLFAYPPWEPDKSGTFFGARLKKLRKACQGPAV